MVFIQSKTLISYTPEYNMYLHLDRSLSINKINRKLIYLVKDFDKFLAELQLELQKLQLKTTT